MVFQLLSCTITGVRPDAQRIYLDDVKGPRLNYEGLSIIFLQMANATARGVINQRINGSEIQLLDVCSTKRKTMEGIVIFTVQA